jgi:hypothetical protein
VTTHAPPFASFSVLNVPQLGLRPECADATAGELAANDAVIADASAGYAYRSSSRSTACAPGGFERSWSASSRLSRYGAR